MKRFFLNFKFKNIFIILFFLITTFLILQKTNLVPNALVLGEENLENKNFKVTSGNESAYVKDNVLYIKNGKVDKVFTLPLNLNKDEQLFINFLLKCDKDHTSKKHLLYIGLFDKNNLLISQIDVRMGRSIKEVKRKLTVERQDTQSAFLKIFTNVDSQVEISNISIWRYKNLSKTYRNICFSLIIILIVYLILRQKYFLNKKAWLFSLSVVIFATGIFLNYLSKTPNTITGDESVYIGQALSFLYDHDNVYNRLDLIRFYINASNKGPIGGFLNYADNAFYYSKTVLYALCGVPFLWFFGSVGLEVFNLYCLFGLVLICFLFLNRKNDASLSAIFSLCFISLSVIWGYIFEAMLDIFNAFIIGGTLLIFTKYLSNQINGSASKKYLYISSFLFGVVCYSRVPYLSFYFFCLLRLICNKEQKFLANLKEFLCSIVIFTLSFGIFTLYHIYQIDSFSPYGGLRYYIRLTAPYAFLHDSSGTIVTKENIFEFIKPINTGTTSILNSSIKALSDIKAFCYNWYYYLIGRQTGCLIYFPCIFLILANFRLDSIKKNWYILVGILGHITFFMLQGFGNYYGGAQSLGNRYFLQILIVFIFLVPVINIKKSIYGFFLTIVIFSTFLIFPYNNALRNAAEFRNRAIMEFLPIEYTQFHTFLGIVPSSQIFYFDEYGVRMWRGPSYKYYPVEPPDTKSYWTRPYKQTLFISSKKPLDSLSFNISSGAIDNEVVINDNRTIKLYKNNNPKFIKVNLVLKHKFYNNYYYEFTIHPKYFFRYKDIKDLKSNDTRELGVYVSNYQFKLKENTI